MLWKVLFKLWITFVHAVLLMMTGLNDIGLLFDISPQSDLNVKLQGEIQMVNEMFEHICSNEKRHTFFRLNWVKHPALSFPEQLAEKQKFQSYIVPNIRKVLISYELNLSADVLILGKVKLNSNCYQIHLTWHLKIVLIVIVRRYYFWCLMWTWNGLVTFCKNFAIKVFCMQIWSNLQGKWHWFWQHVKLWAVLLKNEIHQKRMRMSFHRWTSIPRVLHLGSVNP